MKPTVNISHEQKLISSVFKSLMSSNALNNYFETFMQEIPVDAGYHERVDLTGVEKFEITYSDFLLFVDKVVEVFRSRRIITTEFIVSNNLQLGMARMFAGMAEEGGANFIFTKRDWG